MKKLILFVFLGSFFACGGVEDQKTHNHDDSIKTKEHHHTEEKHHKGAANEYMHQSSTEELIKRFESKERDEYQQPEKVIEFLGDLSEKIVMDIGAGSGYFSVKLARKAKKVIAADVNQEFQDYLKERIEKEEIKNIELRKIPYENPSLQDKEVDMIFIVNTYHHIGNRPDYFNKAKKGLKENGELIIIDFFKTETPVGPPVEHKVSMDEVITELKKAGFSSFNKEVDLLPYQYIIKAQ